MSKGSAPKGRGLYFSPMILSTYDSKPTDDVEASGEEPIIRSAGERR
jgi:hypothetical protein